MQRAEYLQSVVESVDATVVLDIDAPREVGKSVVYHGSSPRQDVRIGDRGKVVASYQDGTRAVRWYSGLASGTVSDEHIDDVSRFWTRGVREEYWG